MSLLMRRFGGVAAHGVLRMRNGENNQDVSDIWSDDRTRAERRLSKNMADTT
jgi:hypothetical protein